LAKIYGVWQVLLRFIDYAYSVGASDVKAEL